MNLRTILGSVAIAGGTALACVLAPGCGQTAQPAPHLKGQVHLTLLHTSDIHSRLFPYNAQLGQVDAGLGLGQANAVVNIGGAARISHIVGRERARASRVLHLDGGDCFQGAPIFNYYSGEAEIRTMVAMGTDAMIVANHEFDRGALNLGIQLQQWSSFPILAANYALEDPKQPGASPLGALIKPFTTFNLEGLKVGVIGMGNLSSLTSIFDSPNRLGITPLNTTETAQFYIDLLRPQVDVIVFVTHLGLDVDERMIESTTGIDVVLGGHNHIVLQPPKRVRDCSQYSEMDSRGEVRNYILLDDGTKPGQSATDPSKPNPNGKTKRYCKPRDVILAHSGAFAKYVGRLDLILSNDPADLANPNYDPNDGFEVLTHEYKLFPVNENVPEDPIVSSLLEPYHQGLDSLANLDLLVGYALDGSKRNSTGGGDSPLGNMISSAMWLRLGIQTDFSLTNSTGIRADLVPGPVTVEQMFNIFPFDNSITKMQLSGKEVQDLFDFVARRSTSRGCSTQVQIAGARIVMDCTKTTDEAKAQKLGPGQATNIYIGALRCKTDSDCLGAGSCDTKALVCRCKSDSACPITGDGTDTVGACDVEAGLCWEQIQKFGTYELATSNYLAGGGSGFRVLQRNTTQADTKVQQRDALIDYIRAGAPCGADDAGKLKDCSTDADCSSVGEAFVCACPETVVEGDLCKTDSTASCSSGTGQCVLARCRDDVAALQHATCAEASTKAAQDQCEASLSPCRSGGEQCKFLACVDRRLGNFSDGRVRMVGQ
jgi:5'-nucleotidase